MQLFSSRSFFLVVLMSVASPAPRAQGDLAKAAADKDAYTMHTFARESLEFNRRTLGSAYDEVGKRDAKWDDAAREFLEAVAQNFSHDHLGMLYRPKEYAASAARCVELGQAALDKGCDDPLVLYLHARVLEMSGRRASKDELREKFRRAYDAMRGSRYGALHLYRAARRALAHAPEEQRAELEEAGAANLLKTVAGPFVNAAHRRTIADYAWAEYRGATLKDTAAFYARLKKSAEADPWIADFFGGNLYVHAAWAARGGGTANTVSEQGWRGFFHNLADAEKCLNAAWKLHPDHPEAPALMITVAMGGGDRVAGSEREWFDRAVAAQFDHGDAYSRYYNALLPRWGGSHEKMLDLGLECARTERYDTEVPYQLVQAMEKIREDARDPSLWKVPEAYAAATKVLATYAERYEDHPIGPWFTSFHAALAWRLGRYEEARPLLERVGEKLDIERFTHLGGSWNAVGEVYARTGPHAADVKHALELDRRHAFKEALALFREIDGKTDDADKATPYLRERITRLDRGVRFEAGEWVNLLPSAEALAANGSRWGAWRIDEQQRLVGTTTGDRMFLTADFGTGPRYELSVTLARQAEPGERLPTCAVTFNYDYTNPGDNLTVNLDYREGTAELFVYNQPYREAKGKLGDPLTVNVRCHDGRSMVTVDGVELTLRHRRPADAHAPRTSLTGVGCMDAHPRGSMIVTEWKIRKLEKAPAADAAAAAEEGA
jgi:hypothetical protein